jgi:hypothetical protein
MEIRTTAFWMCGHRKRNDSHHSLGRVAFEYKYAHGVPCQHLEFKVRIEIRYHCASLGAAVPSDQVGTGIMNSVIGSGAP